MAEGRHERELPPADIERMVRTVRPAWRVRAAAFVEDGITAIYRIEAATPRGSRTCYLKATPDPEHPFGVDAEARLVAVVRAHTDCPVPTVIGAVDEHESVRTPFFLMASMPGRRRSTDALAWLPERHVRSLARQTGRYLGQLHGLSIPGLCRYGVGLTHESGPLRGGQPSGDPADLVFDDGHERWADCLRDWIRQDLEALDGTARFADLVEPIRDTFERAVQTLPAPPPPVVGRVDQGLWNLLTDEAGGRLTAMLDWGSLFVVPPAYDLAATEYFLAGGAWIGLDDVPDRREAIRDGLLAGYRGERPVPDAYDRRRRCYQLEVAIRSLVWLDRGPDRPRHVPADRRDEAAAGMRAVVAGLYV